MVIGKINSVNYVNRQSESDFCLITIVLPVSTCPTRPPRPLAYLSYHYGCPLCESPKAHKPL